MILPNADHWATPPTHRRRAVRTPATSRDHRTGQLTTSERAERAELAELATLVARVNEECPDAQKDLVNRYTHRIAGHVRLIINQPDAIEDVVQMVFIKMFRRLGRLRDPGSFEPWLFRLSRNTALDFIRRRRCRPVTVPVDDALFEIPDPGNADATSEIMDALSVALEQVNPKDRELITHFVEGHTYRSLAQRNGLTLGAVKARLHRLRPFLRSFVGKATETRLPGAVAA